MTIQLPFSIEHEYKDLPDGITIPVSLTSGNYEVAADAKVDTGSAVCLFSREIGLLLGLEIESGLYKPLGSLTGTLDAYGHEVTLTTFDIPIHCFVYFARYPGLRRNLLGRQGWLRSLRMGLVDYENKLYLDKLSS
ncbi:MAG: hypothetical protein M3X11_10090 [Acidobacteriota bacterium]|nr:hypothetical protein [Acidobacteriota bacterium]